MFKKITALAILGVATISSSALAYTSSDVNNANYLAGRNIIRDWSASPSNYNFEKHVARADVIGMVLAMKGITKNDTCRGDFPDIDMNKSYGDWACRTIETAADHGFINGQASVPMRFRKVRPYANISRSEALGIFMNAFPTVGADVGYSYYLNSNFPVDGSDTGYTSAYFFGAPWQATVFYDYIRNVLHDDSALRNNPLVNDSARISEVFNFATHILQQ